MIKVQASLTYVGIWARKYWVNAKIVVHYVFALCCWMCLLANKYQRYSPRL